MAPPGSWEASYHWQPDLVCGIDFGMTGTGKYPRSIYRPSIEDLLRPS